MNRNLFVMAVVLLLVSCGGRRVVPSASDNAGSVVVQNRTVEKIVPKEYTFRLVNSFPHSEGSYTQGLIWHQGAFYEGTGQYGESCLARVELSSGKQLRRYDMPEHYFGEGITMFDGKIYQITWRSGQAFVYDPETFRTLKTFRYDGEGWGLTTDGEVLYMSDGTNRIYVRDGGTFEVLRTFDVTANGVRVNNINELEWIDGKLWANVYLTDRIVVIDSENGQVTANIDMTGLQASEDRTARSDVLNGIAYDEASGRIFVTGKYWNKLYEIEILEKKR